MALPEETGRNGENKPAPKVRKAHIYSTMGKSTEYWITYIKAKTAESVKLLWRWIGWPGLLIISPIKENNL